MLHSYIKNGHQQFIRSWFGRYITTCIYGKEGTVTLGKWTRIVITVYLSLKILKVGNDTLTTYKTLVLFVGGKKCASITKREIGFTHGRFAVDPDGDLDLNERSPIV